MKKSLVLIFLVFSSLIAYSGNVEKQYKKLIENYDVADEAKSVTPINTSAFWVAALDNNELCAKFIKDIQKNKGAEKEACLLYGQPGLLCAVRSLHNDAARHDRRPDACGVPLCCKGYPVYVRRCDHL